MNKEDLSPTDPGRFKLPDGYSELAPSRKYRFFLDVRFPDIQPELLLAVPAKPENLREVAWAAVRQAVEQWLRDSIRYEVVAVKNAEGELVLEGDYSELLELRRQELLEHLGFEEL